MAASWRRRFEMGARERLRPSLWPARGRPSASWTTARARARTARRSKDGNCGAWAATSVACGPSSGHGHLPAQAAVGAVVDAPEEIAQFAGSVVFAPDDASGLAKQPARQP